MQISSKLSSFSESYVIGSSTTLELGRENGQRSLPDRFALGLYLIGPMNGKRLLQDINANTTRRGKLPFCRRQRACPCFCFPCPKSLHANNSEVRLSHHCQGSCPTVHADGVLGLVELGSSIRITSIWTACECVADLSSDIASKAVILHGDKCVPRTVAILEEHKRQTIIDNDGKE